MTGPQPEAAMPPVSSRFYTRAMNRYRRLGWYVPGVPSTIRWALMLHARRNRSRVLGASYRHAALIDEWWSQRRIFFGFGLFRSGTTFLSQLLDSCAQGAEVRHEPNICDYLAYTMALAKPSEAGSYIRPYRFAETWLRMRGIESLAYGEVNPYLRRHAGALQAALPAAPMFHLVRDGRDVVRSLASRELFARHDPMAPLIQPPANDSYRDRWQSMSRFERLCWLWQADNRYLRQTVGHLVRLENVLHDFGYFQDRVLRHVDLAVNVQTWSAATKTAVNPTPGHALAAWPDWPQAQRDTFERICGEEMVACGYVR